MFIFQVPPFNIVISERQDGSFRAANKITGNINTSPREHRSHYSQQPPINSLNDLPNQPQNQREIVQSEVQSRAASEVGNQMVNGEQTATLIWSALRKNYPNLISPQAKLQHLQLLNGNQVVVSKNFKSKFDYPYNLYRGDALLSGVEKSEQNQEILSLLVGDCFPVFLFDRQTRQMAVIHAGWQPLALNILPKTLTKFLKTSKAKIANIYCYLGPGIRAESYQSASRPQQLAAKKWSAFIHEISSPVIATQASITQASITQPLAQTVSCQQTVPRWQIDLARFIKWQLNKLGVSTSQIIDSELDTFGLKKRFFSHHRAMQNGEEDGRFFASIFVDKI